MAVAAPLVLLLLGGALVWGLWTITQPPRAFVIRVHDGKATVASGKATPGFLREVRDVTAEHAIESGTVVGVVQDHGRIALRFSSDFPPAARQQLRNVWTEVGWSARRR